MEGSHRVIVSKPARPATGGMFRQAASAAVSETKHDTPQAQAGGSEGGQERSDSVSWEEGQPRSSRCDSVLKEFLSMWRANSYRLRVNKLELELGRALLPTLPQRWCTLSCTPEQIRWAFSDCFDLMTTGVAVISFITE